VGFGIARIQRYGVGLETLRAQNSMNSAASFSYSLNARVFSSVILGFSDLALGFVRPVYPRRSVIWWRSSVGSMKPSKNVVMTNEVDRTSAGNSNCPEPVYVTLTYTPRR